MFLDFFKDKQKSILYLRSGDKLQIEGAFLKTTHNGKSYRVAKFSKSFTEKIDKLSEKGYSPASATVRLILWWKPQNEEKETAIFLPEIKFTKIVAQD